MEYRGPVEDIQVQANFSSVLIQDASVGSERCHFYRLSLTGNGSTFVKTQAIVNAIVAIAVVVLASESALLQNRIATRVASKSIPTRKKKKKSLLTPRAYYVLPQYISKQENQIKKIQKIRERKTAKSHCLTIAMLFTRGQTVIDMFNM